MASRRQLKKSIDYIVNDLLAECMIAYYYIPGTDTKKVLDTMNKLSRLNAEFIDRINHTEPGNVKAYYKQLKESFNKEIDQIIDDIAEFR